MVEDPARPGVLQSRQEGRRMEKYRLQQLELREGGIDDISEDR